MIVREVVVVIVIVVEIVVVNCTEGIISVIFS